MRNCLFLGGGTIPDGWRAVHDDLTVYVARQPKPQPVSAFRAAVDPFAPMTDYDEVRYERRRFGGTAVAGQTCELVIIDGWLLPRRPIIDPVHHLFVRQGYEPQTQVLTEEVFWRTPGTRLTGPWDQRTRQDGATR